MKRIGLAVAAVGILAASSAVALAQPAYGPNAVDYNYYSYYQPYAAYPPAPPAAVYPYSPYYYDGAHSSGSASRAYSYWGAQKSN